MWTIQNYKAEIVFVGLKSIVDFLSSHIHKWERFHGPGLFFVQNNFFFKFPIQCLLVPMYVLRFYFFSTFVV